VSIRVLLRTAVLLLMRFPPRLTTSRVARGLAAILLWPLITAALPAQLPPLPPGRLDSATVYSLLQMADAIAMDDRAQGFALFDALWRRRADLPEPSVANVAASRATISGDREAQVEAWRDLARLRPTNDYQRGLMRVLLSAGRIAEARELAARYEPTASEARVPVREELEAEIAELLGDWPAMRRAVDAASAYPRWPTLPFSYSLRLSALAGSNARRALGPLLDSALAQTPRGYRIDPVVYYSDYGNRLAVHGQDTLAARAWQRALVVLDSLRPQAEARGAVGLDSVRLTRGRLLLSLGRVVEATELLRAPSRRLEPRERYRVAWLAIAELRGGDRAAALSLDRALAADTVFVLRGATAVSRAMIAEALGETSRGAALLLASRRYIDVRGLPNNPQLARTLRDPSVQAWLRGS